MSRAALASALRAYPVPRTLSLRDITGLVLRVALPSEKNGLLLRRMSSRHLEKRLSVLGYLYFSTNSLGLHSNYGSRPIFRLPGRIGVHYAHVDDMLKEDNCQ